MNIIFKPECKTEIIKPTYDLPIIGEPISKTGASANDGNAYGVIVGIIGDGSSRRVRVMTEGYIDYDKVKENYMEYTEEAINALTGITLCSGGKLPTGGGGGGGGETKNFYLFEFDDTDQAYYVQNITTGEWDEDYGGTVSQQLLEEFNKNMYDVMSRVVCTLGPAGGVTAQYKPIGVTIYGGAPKFVFYAYGSSYPINTTATWRDGRWN